MFPSVPSVPSVPSHKTEQPLNLFSKKTPFPETFPEKQNTKEKV